MHSRYRRLGKGGFTGSSSRRGTATAKREPRSILSAMRSWPPVTPAARSAANSSRRLIARNTMPGQAPSACSQARSTTPNTKCSTCGTASTPSGTPRRTLPRPCVWNTASASSPRSPNGSASSMAAMPAGRPNSDGDVARPTRCPTQPSGPWRSRKGAAWRGPKRSSSARWPARSTTASWATRSGRCRSRCPSRRRQATWQIFHSEERRHERA